MNSFPKPIHNYSRYLIWRVGDTSETFSRSRFCIELSLVSRSMRTERTLYKTDRTDKIADLSGISRFRRALSEMHSAVLKLDRFILK